MRESYNIGRYLSVLLVILAIGVIVFKTDWNVDEYFSYALSNHIGSFHIEVENGVTYDSVDTPFLENYTANSSDRFNYVNVWKNQAADVHPPLYYVLLHTICSFFPGSFSVWYAGIINIIFVVVTFGVYRKLLCLYTTNETIRKIASVVFVFSAGILSGVSFLRMYVMAMCFVIGVAYLFTKAIVEDSVDWKWYVYSFLLAMCCAMTHYYCILYLVVSCVVLGIWMLCRKKWKNVLGFIVTMGVAGGLSFLLFPAMLEHVFSGYRGTQSLENLSAFSWEEYWDRIKVFVEIINGQIFGGLLLYVFVFGALGFFLVGRNLFGLWKEKVSEQKLKSAFKWAVVVVPVVVYFLLVSKMAVYLSDRYIYPIYAVALLLGVVGTCKIVIVLTESEGARKALLALFGAVLIVNTWVKNDWQYMYLEQAERLETIQKYKGTNAIIVYDATWRIQQMNPEVSILGSGIYINGNETNLLDQYKYRTDKELILLSTWNDQTAALNNVMDKLPYINKYEKLGNFGYHTTYRLYSEGKTCSIQALNGSVQLESVYLMSTEDGYVSILTDGLALDVQKGVFAQGTVVSPFAPNGTVAQNWKIVDAGDGTSYIESANQDYCLACDAAGQLYIATKDVNATEQKWKVAY